MLHEMKSRIFSDKKYYLILIFILIASASFAGVVTKKYVFDEPTITEDGIYSKIFLNKGVALGNPGEPEVPFINASLLLPRNESISDVSISFGEKVYMGHYSIYPLQEQLPISKMDQAEFINPDQKVYSSSKQYPYSNYSGVTTNCLSGYSIGSIAITPISYNPSTQELYYYEDLTVSFTTDYDEAVSEAGKYLFEDKNIIRRVENIVDNPHATSDYSTRRTRDEEALDIVIITGEDHVDDFQPLVDFHITRGYRTGTKTVEDIYDNYTGVDNANKVRNYIKDQYATHGPIQYVIFGGDTDVVPYRKFYANVGNEQGDIPADMYFSNLDRTNAPGSGPDWNNDNDNRWGEPAEADLFSELFIGRIFFNNITEIENQLNKIQLFSESPVTGNLKSSLMIGEYLWPNTYGGQYMNELISGCSTNGYTTIGIPGDWNIPTLYEMDYGWTSTNLYNELNQGPTMVNHLGHGNLTHCLNIDNPDLTVYNISNDGTNANFFNGYSQACYPGSFDNMTISGYVSGDCFYEKITSMPTAAATWIGNSRYGWGMQGSTNGASQVFHREYIDALFDDNEFSVGGANALSKEHAVAFVQTSGVHRWCCYELNVFGNPALDIWTNEPMTMTPTFPENINAGTEEISVIAEPDARVVIYDDDTVYGFGQIDSFGNGTITFDEVPVNSGNVNIAFTAHDYFKYLGEIHILTSVVNFTPDTLYANVPTDICVNVIGPDSITPQVGVNVWAEGVGYTSDIVPTDEDGNAILSIDYPYGPSLQIYGQIPGEEFLIFEDAICVIADDLSDPDLTVETNYDLTDAFACNLPGMVFASVNNDETTLWVKVDAGDYVSTSELTMEVTPTTFLSVIAVIAKSGYNIYQESFPVEEVYGTVSGEVKNISNGLPIENAEVKFYEAGVIPSGDPVFSSVTDSDGQYEITADQPVDYYDIYITRWGYEPYQELNYFLDFEENEHDIMLVPVESCQIYGNVRDTLDVLPNATLNYTLEDGEQCASIQTDVDGNYFVELPVGYTYLIDVSFADHVPYNGEFELTENIGYNYFLGQAALSDNCENGLEQWDTSLWGTTTLQSVSPNHSFTESPYGNYSNNQTYYLKLSDPLDLSTFTSADLHFYTKWWIEGNDYDYAQVQASLNGYSWTALEGLYTEPGAGSFQPNGQPVYDDTQEEWVYEEMDLSDYVGEDEVHLRFALFADQGVNEDGWYIDDILVGDPESSYAQSFLAIGDEPINKNKLVLMQNFPNPVQNATTISFAIPANTEKAQLKIYNILGQLVKSYTPQIENTRQFDYVWNGNDNRNRPVANGIYFYRLSTAKKDITKKMIFLR
ncbi:MAG: C25 family cysteine peptidase [Candidatus Cloacimonadota bacterium]|nr:C25 family cysteine peptidase [Candidatus Cloacimonadota bacterium]